MPADVAPLVEGEKFDDQPPSGTRVVTDTTLYSPPNGQALKFTNNTAIAKHTLTFDNQGAVVLVARGGRSGGSPTLSVKVDGVNGGQFSDPQSITNTGDPVAYTYDLDVPAGLHTIEVKAGNVGTGRNPFLDFVSFPASGTDPDGDRDDDGIPDAEDNCPEVFNPHQYDRDDDGVGNACEDGSTTPTDADNDSVPDSSDNCPNVSNPQQRDDDDDGVGNKCDTGSPEGDRDADGIPDADDNCPDVHNVDQADSDGDGIGDACETQTPGSAVLVGAGDISSGGKRDNQTGVLVQQELDNGAFSAFTTGDNAYPDGTYNDYQVYYAAWGSFKDMTRPTYGNHEYYSSSTAVGSEQYWNEASDPTPVRVSNAESFYAYDVGDSNWRAIVLNSVSTEAPTSNRAPSCAAGSAQMNFLINELNTNKNTVLFWHHARFSASSDHPTSEGATGCSKTFFDVAYDNDADFVVQGHSHVYERYDTRDKTGRQVEGGLTSIVCGTGGNSFADLQNLPSPAPDVAFADAWGVCKLTLSADKAQVDFLPAPGSPGKDRATVDVRP